ncbi:hypothetical protein SAMN04489712_1722 [Thermomonospora echinospora]|uniref:Uncharacterized protein n=1 Tax=Thermomonospora echinospora TaxID=1992 RepID=A0A1H6EBN6_9ACTN|nr:hypothetical protein [Thermomonospora echinospora]SEG95177.1 hypothetical protein SAMN04489712_1722 [Thermomonospora echinospora]
MTGQHGPGHDHPARPDAPPMDAGQAQALAGRIRRSIAEVERAWGVLADLVCQAHQGQAWRALGYASWGEYAHAEFGIGRAHAYRLVDMATTAEQLHGAVAEVVASLTGPVVSPAGDALALLSGRALRDVRGRVDQVAAVLAERLQQATTAEGKLTSGQVAELVRQAVAEVRALAPPAQAGRSPAAPRDPDGPIAEGRALVERLYAGAAEIGRMCLEIAPAYLSEDQASRWLEPFADEIGLTLEDVLARRRYAITGDRRAVRAFLWPPHPRSDL